MPKAPLPAIRDSSALAEIETPEDAKAFYDKLEAFARHYRHDHEKQNLIAEAKLRTARKGGELLTADAESRRATVPTPPLPDGFTKSMSSRWQRLAGLSEDAFQEHLDARREAGEEITLAAALTFAKLGVHLSSDSDEWETPQEFFDLLAAEFPFNLDVCATAENAKCERYFTKEDDGLAQYWEGVCWMNPPYGDEVAKWVTKAWGESLGGRATVVCLLPARVDTNWWWGHCRFGEIRFLRGRLRFGGGENSAPFPSAVVIFRRPAKVVWWEAWPL